MVKLDVATLGFFAGLVSIASGLVIALLFMKRKQAMPGALQFLLAVTFYGLGVLMIALRGSVFSEPVGILGGNFLVALSAVYLHQGTLKILDRSFPIWIDLLGVVYTMAGFLYFFYWNYNVNLRIVVVSSMRLPFLLHGCWLLFRYSPKKNNAGFFLLNWVSLAWLVWYSVRTVGTATNDKQIIDFLALQGFQAFHYFITGFGNVIIVVAFLKVVDDRNLESVIRLKDAEREAHAAWMESERVKALTRRLVETAHQAGMAEIAVGALHNVGNLLNSISVSQHMITEEIRNSSLRKLEKANDLLRNSLSDPTLARYYEEVGRVLKTEHDTIQSEMDQLSRNMDLAKGTIRELQAYAKGRPLVEEVCLADLIEEVLEIEAPELKTNGIEVIKNIDASVVVQTQKGKVSHVILNVVKNAREALMESPHPRKLWIDLRDSGHGSVQLKVSDSGIGIEQENMRSLFQFGYTTKPQGNGFGLHASVNTMYEVGGTIEASSDGLGKGATFLLRIPTQMPTQSPAYQS